MFAFGGASRRGAHLIAFRNQVKFFTRCCIADCDAIVFAGFGNVDIPIVNTAVNFNFLDNFFNRVGVAVAGDFQEPENGFGVVPESGHRHFGSLNSCSGNFPVRLQPE